MPKFDKTGPMGKGPMSGQGLGGCSSEDLKQFKDMGFYKDTPKRPFDGRGGGQGPNLGIGHRRNLNK